MQNGSSKPERRVGPPECRWRYIIISPSFTDECDAPSSLLNSELLLCERHAKAVAKMTRYFPLEETIKIANYRQQGKVERLEERNRELRRLLDQALAAPAKPQREPVPEMGTVYFLRIGGFVKIGWTSNLERRMKEYPPDTVLLAVMPGTRKDEKRTHKRFAHLKTHGREWFPLAPQITEFIETVVRDHGTPPVVDFSARSTTRTVGPRLKQYVGGNNRGTWQRGTIAG